MIASVIVRDRHLPRGVICYELGVCPAQLEGRWISPTLVGLRLHCRWSLGGGAVAETVGLAIITNNNRAAGAPLSPQDHPLSQPPHCDSSICNLQLDLLEVFSCVDTNGCHQTQVRSHCLPLVYGCNSSTGNWCGWFEVEYLTHIEVTLQAGKLVSTFNPKEIKWKASNHFAKCINIITWSIAWPFLALLSAWISCNELFSC